MIVERITVNNFKCFGPEGHTIELDEHLTVLIGANGSGKTALMQALLRMFGITPDQRRIRRQDFFVPNTDAEATDAQRTLSIEVLLSFPELSDPGDEITWTIPQFLHQSAIEDGGNLKCRLRIDATWTDDGSIEGVVDHSYFAIRTLESNYTSDQCHNISAAERNRIQIIYIPARRDGTSQVSSFLRGRLWRAIQWTDELKDTLRASGKQLNDAFEREPGVQRVESTLTTRWQEVPAGGTDSKPSFRPLDVRMQEFARKVEVLFFPDEEGRTHSLDDLSDGQRSLFHVAMMAATLDVESSLARGTHAGFLPDRVVPPALTLIAVEEPENSLAPFYLSRIVGQLADIANHTAAQAIVSSHSPSVMSRIDPEQVRYFRKSDRASSSIRPITLPQDATEALKYVREAVRTFPELYFARFVILGEGASEEIVIPRVADAFNISIDRSFVAIVPLGGRHTNHLWRLLSNLDIPHATLLDLDLGRSGAGWGRIKDAIDQLLISGVNAEEILASDLLPADAHSLESSAVLGFDDDDLEALKTWRTHLRKFEVFLSWHLDLDMALLSAFPNAYKETVGAERGPSDEGDARSAVLGTGGTEVIALDEEEYRWYRYLFLGKRGKPASHVRAMVNLADETIKANAPEDLVALVRHVESAIDD